MYLKSLELSGFKSFAKKSELTFGAPISAIVGPNGSGKSNVAEAFRFVLGEQSIKSMRGKRGEDLIWNGSNEVGRANRASAKIVFDNRKRFLNLDFDEVSVERVVYRDGINEYLINGTQVRLRDVAELIASAHISSSGHHTISQGEADKILNASARDRKSMIEDALGLKIFQYKREESERKLAKTEENIKSVEALRREITPHLKFLKKQVEKVEKAIELKDKLGVLYKEYLKRESVYISEKKAEIEREKEPLAGHLKRLEEELAAAKEILSRSKTADKKSADLISLENKIRKARNEKDRLMRELGRVEGGIASEERIAKREKELLHSTKDGVVALKDVEELANLLEAQIEKAKKEEDASVLRQAMAQMGDFIRNFIFKQKSKANGNLTEESEKVIGNLREEKAVFEKKTKEISHEEERLQKEYSHLQRDIEKEKDTDRAAEKKVFEIMSAQNEIISKMNTVKGAAERLELEEENFKRELAEAGALIGREILDFEKFELSAQNGPEERGRQDGRRREIERIKIRLEEDGGGSSNEVLKEYRDVSERDTFLARELEDLEKSAETLKKLIGDLLLKINNEFRAGVEKINKQFEGFFALMFGGGSASLTIVKEKPKKRTDEMADLLRETEEASALSRSGITAGLAEDGSDEEEPREGIEISVNLPRKKVRSLMMLSGGERALTSIALIFAISQVNPPPFIVLDETDAALDEANSKKYGDLIENLSKLSQLILITHNRETMSRAGILYGVTMTGGASRLLSIKFDEAMAAVK